MSSKEHIGGDDSPEGPRLKRSTRSTQLPVRSDPAPFDQHPLSPPSQSSPTDIPTNPLSPPAPRAEEPSAAARASLKMHPQQQVDAVKLFKHAWNELDEAEEREANKISDAYMGSVRRRLSAIDTRTERLLQHRSSQNLRMQMQEAYEGARLPEDDQPILMSHVSALIESFKLRSKLHYSYAHRIVTEIFALFDKTKHTVNFINVPEGTELVVVGDLHGQLSDLLTLLQLTGLPSEKKWFLFNGDFVDRGNNSVEVLFILYAFKLALPNCVFLNRGNHEHKLLNSRYSFTAQVKQAYDEPLYKLIAKSFETIPYCAVINQKIFVVHGGLTNYELDMNYIQTMDLREVPREPKTKMEKVMKDLMWSDPVEEAELKNEAAAFAASLMEHGQSVDAVIHAGWVTSRRGAGILFSDRLTSSFLKSNGFDYMVRSHQMVPQGYLAQHKGQLYTLFSASRYCDKGAVMTLRPESLSTPIFQSYYAEYFPGIQDYENSPPVPQNPIVTHAPVQQAAATIDPAHPTSPPKESVRSLPPTSTEAIIQESLQKIGQKIFSKRHKLLIEFSNCDQQCTGTVPVDVWEIVLRKVLKLNIPWRALWPHLRPQTESARLLSLTDVVAYRKFLDRYMLQIDENLASIWRSDEGRVANQLLSKIASHRDDLQRLFQALDIHRTGKLSYSQFAQILNSLELGLSGEQIYDFICSMDTNRDGSISLQEFTDRFKVYFEKFQKAGEDGETVSSDASMMLRLLAEKMFSRSAPTLSNIKFWFKKADTDNFGRLDFSKFEKLLNLVQLSTVWSKNQQLLVFNLIDANASGEISYREWKKAFSFVVMESAQSRRVLSFITRYSSELLVGFVTCDVDGKGKLHDVEEFKSVLMPLVELKHMANEIFDRDVEDVYAALADRDGCADYHRLLKSATITSRK